MSSAVMPPSLDVYTGQAFHYTSARGLLETLKGQQIWASSSSSLNDLGEVRQGWDLVRETLEGMPDSSTTETLRSLAEDELSGRHEVFVLSASTRDDDAAQWRLYADQGRGFAIGLDAAVPLAAVSKVPKPLIAAPPAKRRTFSFTGVKDAVNVSPWRRVLYDPLQVRQAIEELIPLVEAEERSITGTKCLPEEEVSLAWDDLRTQAYDVLATLAHLSKSPGFAGEAEVRTVVTFAWGTDHIEYREGLNGLVGYTSLATATTGGALRVMRPVDDKTPLKTAIPVTSIRLGPLLLEEQQSTVEAFLMRYGLKHVDVTRSAVPLR